MAIQPSHNILNLGTVMFVGAHPDDETFCAGGLLAAAVRNGQRVICVTATRGEKGIQDSAKWPKERLAEIRTTELEAALAELGITEHYWLGCRDGGCERCPEGECCTRLSDIMSGVGPDSIITFGPDGLTGHPDHCQVSGWVDEAVSDVRPKCAVYHVVLTPETAKAFEPVQHQFNVFFNTNRPRTVAEQDCALVYTLDDKVYDAKLRALRAMPSQTESLLGACSEEQLRAMFGCEAFVTAK